LAVYLAGPVIVPAMPFYETWLPNLNQIRCAVASAARSKPTSRSIRSVGRVVELGVIRGYVHIDW